MRTPIGSLNVTVSFWVQHEAKVVDRGGGGAVPRILIHRFICIYIQVFQLIALYATSRVHSLADAAISKERS